MQKYNIIIDKHKKETTQHGSYEFPLAIYTTRIVKNILGFIDWHWHEELQFCIITKGSVQFRVNSDSILLSEGEGLFINRDQLHKAENCPGTDSTFICVDFHPNLISSFAGSLINTKYIQLYTDNAAIQYCTLNPGCDWQAAILAKLRSVYDEYDQQAAGYELRIQILLLEIWRTLLESYFVSFSTHALPNDNTHLKKVISYINQHYMEKLELADLAKEMGLSKSACCREFKRHMKCTLFEYIINYRLVISTKLLLTTSQSITGIAYQCGFGSTSYFIAKFKKKTGVAPLVYRKEKMGHNEGILTTLNKEPSTGF
jgi:AraC-type DNA-binding domain-containing proteins